MAEEEAVGRGGSTDRSCSHPGKGRRAVDRLGDTENGLLMGRRRMWPAMKARMSPRLGAGTEGNRDFCLV